MFNSIVLTLFCVALPIVCLSQSDVELSSFTLEQIEFSEPTSSNYTTHLMHDKVEGLYLFIMNDEREMVYAKLGADFSVQSQSKLNLTSIDSIDRVLDSGFDGIYSIGDTLFIFDTFFSKSRKERILICYQYWSGAPQMQAQIVDRELATGLNPDYTITFNRNTSRFGIYYKRFESQKPITFSIAIVDQHLNKIASRDFAPDVPSNSGFLDEIMLYDDGNVFLAYRVALKGKSTTKKKYVDLLVKCNPADATIVSLNVDSSIYQGLGCGFKLIGNVLVVVNFHGDVRNSSSGSSQDIDTKSVTLSVVNTAAWKVTDQIIHDLTKQSKRTEARWTFSDLSYDPTGFIYVIYNKTELVFKNNSETNLFKYDLLNDSISWIKHVSSGANKAWQTYHHNLLNTSKGLYVVPLNLYVPSLSAVGETANNSEYQNQILCVQDTGVLKCRQVVEQTEGGRFDLVHRFDQLQKTEDIHFLIGLSAENVGIEKRTKDLTLLKVVPK